MHSHSHSETFFKKIILTYDLAMASDINKPRVPLYNNEAPYIYYSFSTDFVGKVTINTPAKIKAPPIKK